MNEDFKITSSATIQKSGYKVSWNGMIESHCRTAKQALALARKKTKHAEYGDTYIAVRVTTTTKTEFLEEIKNET